LSSPEPGGGDGLHPRIVTPADLPGVTATLAGAFAEDPLWTWAFPDDEKREAWWRFLLQSVLRFPCTWVAGDFEAVSVWIPPGGTELTDADEERVEPLLEDLLGPGAQVVMDLLDRFGESHPKDVPHYYLSLLGTHPAHRGRGLGMRLLVENLEAIDGEGIPAYLESSNPANCPRYEQIGFERIGSFATPDGAHEVAMMWRAPR
jgi:GNAT superfamily N-acetyltransferase